MWVYPPALVLDFGLFTKKRQIMKTEYLRNHFTPPKILSPFYGDIRVSRKLKKRIKKYCDVHWQGNSNGQRLWYYMGKINPKYKWFLISLVK